MENTIGKWTKLLVEHKSEAAKAVCEATVAAYKHIGDEFSVYLYQNGDVDWEEDSGCRYIGTVKRIRLCTVQETEPLYDIDEGRPATEDEIIDFINDISKEGMMTASGTYWFDEAYDSACDEDRIEE